jgi:hypothetical protein
MKMKIYRKGKINPLFTITIWLIPAITYGISKYLDYVPPFMDWFWSIAITFNFVFWVRANWGIKIKK